MQEIDMTTAEGLVKQISKWDTYIDKYLPTLISFGLRLVLSAVFFIIGMKIIKWIRKFIKNLIIKAGLDVGVAQFLDSILRILLYVVLLMMIADGFGIDTTSILALLGSAGLAAGLALPGSLSNFAGGVLILD